MDRFRAGLALTITLLGSGACGGSAGTESASGDAGPSEDAAVTPDASTDDASLLCAPAPSLADAGACTLAIYYLGLRSITLWVEDGAAQGGGSRITLKQGETASAGGHTFHYPGAWIGTSVGGLHAEIALDIDGDAGVLGFNVVGCASGVSPAWDYDAALERVNPLCPACGPTSIARHFSVAGMGADGGVCGAPCAGYTFSADDPPRGCGAGFDLLGFVAGD